MKRVRPASIELLNAQRAVKISMPELRSFAQRAIALVWPRKRANISLGDAVLIVIVSDKRMAELHEQFCGIAGPTDVLTFQHGEIVISALTAARQARVYRVSLAREIRLYILHGLLHLCGYDDTEPRARAAMRRLQKGLLALAIRLEKARSFERGSPRVNLRDAPAASSPGNGLNERGHRQRGGRIAGHRKK